MLLRQDRSLLRSWFKYHNDEDELVDKVLIWGHVFMPEYFRDVSPEFHRDLVKMFFSEKNEYTAAPRGFSKTTIMQLCICYAVAHRLDKFIVIVEKTWLEAAEVISVVSSVFKSPFVQFVYQTGFYVDEGGQEGEERESKGDLLINGVRIRGKGFNTSIRGLKSKAYRPTRIILDDIEEDEHIRNEDQRKKYLDNYLRGIVPALEVGKHIKMVGTILHQDSLLKNMIDTHGGKVYEAWDRSKPDPQNYLLWPERWTYDRLMEKQIEMTAVGKPSSAFWQEYFNDPIGEDQRLFKWDWLQDEYEEADIKTLALTTVVAIDCADSSLDSADFTGIASVSMDMNGNWYVKRAQRFRGTINDLVDHIFSLWNSEKPLVIGVEKRAFIDQIKPLIDEKIRILEAQGIFAYPNVVELKHHGTSKINRVVGALQGRFENRKIHFKRGATDNQKDLRMELYDFPTARYDDLADALAYCDQLYSPPPMVRRESSRVFSGGITY